MKILASLVLALGLFASAHAQNSVVRSVSVLPNTCNPGGGPGGLAADHVDLWNGTVNVPYYCQGITGGVGVWTILGSAAPTTANLTIACLGLGTGQVTTSDGIITAACNAGQVTGNFSNSYPVGTVVTVSANATGSSQFISFQGVTSCGAVSPCTFTMGT